MKILFSKDSSIDLLSPMTNIGDAIVVKDGSLYQFFVHNISGLVLVDKIESIKVIEGHYGVSTIFDKNDLQTRTGDAEVLHFLTGVFKNTDIQTFFQTAYDILKFKEERWDCDVLSRLYTTEMSIDNNENERDFISYLNDYLKLSYVNLLKDGKTKSEALRLIKDKFKDDFMCAFTEFKKSYPNKSILE